MPCSWGGTAFATGVVGAGVVVTGVGVAGAGAGVAGADCEVSSVAGGWAGWLWSAGAVAGCCVASGAVAGGCGVAGGGVAGAGRWAYAPRLSASTPAQQKTAVREPAKEAKKDTLRRETVGICIWRPLSATLTGFCFDRAKRFMCGIKLW
jgi:hypothetical protein